MKPFKFTLQAVRTLRERREQQALESYAAALAERRAAEEAIKATECSIAQGQVEWRRIAAAGCAASELAEASKHFEMLGAQRQRQAVALKEAEDKAEARLKEMLWARQQMQAVEKLLAKQKLNHGKLLAQEEQKLADERAQRCTESPLAYAAHDMKGLT